MRNEAHVPPAQKTYYDELFQIADADKDSMIGPAEASFFRKSQLNDETLREIWQIADSKNIGYLDNEEFIIALKLISLAQLGAPLSLDTIKAMPVVPPPKLQDVHPIKFDWVVPQSEKNTYVEIFHKNDDDGDGFINGSQAKTLFGSSGLPTKILGHIWFLSDMNNDQKLDCQEFIIATFIIRSVLKGFDLPSRLPDSLIQSSHYVPGGGFPSPKIPEWFIPPAERIIYEDIFNKNQQNGFISGPQAKVLFEKSGLPVQDLKVIWELSDYNQEQVLDKQKFVIAMYLISQRKKKKELPTSLPTVLLESSKANFQPTSPPVIDLNQDKTSSGKYNIDLNEIVSQTTPVSQLSLDNELSNNTNNHQGGGVLLPSPTNSNTTMSNPNPLRNSQTTMSPPNSTSTMSSGGGGFIQQTFTGPRSSPAHHNQMISPPPVSTALMQTRENIERTKQAVMERERSNADLRAQFEQEAAANLELQQQLQTEQRKLDELMFETKEYEEKVQQQKQSTIELKESISSVRVDIKLHKSQLEQTKKLLEEKTEQFEEENEALTTLQGDLQEKKSDLEKYNQELEKLKQQIESIKSLKKESKNELKQVNATLVETKGEVKKLNEEYKTLKAQQNLISPQTGSSLNLLASPKMPPQQQQQQTPPTNNTPSTNVFDDWGVFDTVTFTPTNNSLAQNTPSPVNANITATTTTATKSGVSPSVQTSTPDEKHQLSNSSGSFKAFGSENPHTTTSQLHGSTSSFQSANMFEPTNAKDSDFGSFGNFGESKNNPWSNDDTTSFSHKAEIGSDFSFDNPPTHNSVGSGSGNPFSTTSPTTTTTTTTTTTHTKQDSFETFDAFKNAKDPFAGQTHLPSFATPPFFEKLLTTSSSQTTTTTTTTTTLNNNNIKSPLPSTTATSTLGRSSPNPFASDFNEPSKPTPPTTQTNSSPFDNNNATNTNDGFDDSFGDSWPTTTTANNNNTFASFNTTFTPFNTPANSITAENLFGDNSNPTDPVPANPTTDNNNFFFDDHAFTEKFSGQNDFANTPFGQDSGFA